jgi:hypothetical protein
MEVPQSGVGLTGPGEPSGAGGYATRPSPRRRWWRWLLAAVIALLLSAVVVLWSMAAAYQPVQFGGGFSPPGDFAGMPAGTGLRLVNNFAMDPGQLYVPPQNDRFGVVGSLYNGGPSAVTIEAVTVVNPGQPSGIPPYPLIPDGTPQWLSVTIGPGQPSCPATMACSVAGLVLRPGQQIEVAIPVRFTYACDLTDGWFTVRDLFVRIRFGPFTQWVTGALSYPYVFHETEPPGTEKQGEVCAS